MKMIRMTTCMLAMALPGLALANDRTDKTHAANTQRERSGQDSFAAEDLQVMARIHQTNQMEIDLGRVASQNGMAKDVKRYGERLVKDHERADKHLLSLAKDRKTELPAVQPKDDAEKEHQQKEMATADKLKSLSGAEFDRTFSTAMVDGHEQAIQMLETAQNQVADSKLKSFIGKLLPTLKDHLSMAKKLTRNVASVRPQ